MSSMFCLENIIDECVDKCKRNEIRFCYSSSGINALWWRMQIKMDTGGEKYWLSQVKIVKKITDLIKNPWTNGAIICTLSPEVEFKNKAPCAKRTLMDQLGEDGFKLLDPFIPIQVLKLTDEEFELLYNYYQ